MKSGFFKISLPIITGILLVIFAISNLRVPALADGDGSDATCSNTDVSVDPNDDGSQTPFSFNYNAPAGNNITGVCIKSGSNMFGGNKHSSFITSNGTIENGCYTISGIGTSQLTVTRNNSGSSCQGISHFDIEYGPGASPSPSPSPSATPTPSPSPSPSPSPTPSVSPTPTPSPSPTPTPSPSPTPGQGSDPSPTPSPTPSPDESPRVSPSPTPDPSVSPSPSPQGSTSDDDDDSDDNDDDNDKSEESKNEDSEEPQILGATGAFNQILTFIAGFGMVTAGLWQAQRAQRESKKRA